MKALIVEDDRILCNTIYQCIKDNFDADKAYSGDEGLLLAKQNIYDIIILDLMMPILDGYEVLSTLRRKKILTPVLILTAKDGLDDKVKGLKIGADDYLVKPFETAELLARMEAIIRRNIGNYAGNIVVFKEISLELKRREATINGNSINLQGKQFDVLEYLISSKNKILTKEQIFDRVWGWSSDTTVNVVEVYASGIRKELKPYGYDKYLKTVRGLGYMMKEE